MKKERYIVSKKFVTYAYKNLVLMMIIKSIGDNCSSRKQSDPGHFFKSQDKTFQPFLYTLF